MRIDLNILRRKCGQHVAFRWVAATVSVSLAIVSGCSRDDQPTVKSSPVVPSQRIAVAGIGFQEDQFFRLAEAGMIAAAKNAGAELLTGSSAGRLDKEMDVGLT